MIPDFDEMGLLPKGIHWADRDEVKGRYAWNDHRRRLMEGFERALRELRQAGCPAVYLDGSFVTAKEFPADYDACWEATGVKIAALDPVFVDFGNRRAAQKAKYFGEFFPAQFCAENNSPFRTFLEFFQVDKETGTSKGIIGIRPVKDV